MTTITRKTRTVTQEYWEVETESGRCEVPTLAEARSFLHQDVFDWLYHKGPMQSSSEANSAVRHLIEHWDQLKAIIEGVRVEEEKARPNYSLSPGDAMMLMLSGRRVAPCGDTHDVLRIVGDYVVGANGDRRYLAKFWAEDSAKGLRFVVIEDAAPAASPETA